MSDAPIPILPEENCWKQIGVWGDRSCPELARVFDCRNCEVYSSSGRRLLDRPAPKDYIESWTTLLAEEEVVTQTVTSPYLVFRVGQAWFAFLATSLQEVTAPSVVRSVPHRPREVLLGLVNVRGELHPCISLHTMFTFRLPSDHFDEQYPPIASLIPVSSHRFTARYAPWKTARGLRTWRGWRMPAS